MSQMSAIMKEKNRQADERLKLMSDIMQRRDSKANNRMIDLMTMMQDLTQEVKTVVSQTAAAPARAASAPLAFKLANMHSTCAGPPPTQVTYRKIAQPSGEKVTLPKLKPPATYKKDSTNASKMARVMHAESRVRGRTP